MRKRIISLCMALVLCLSLLPATALAAGSSYVALGDSITTGYGLGAGEQSFAELVAEARGYDLDDSLAAAGAVSADLLEVVTDPANAETLKNANLITITIGGNDLMGALYAYVAEAYNKTAQTPVTGTDIQLALMGMHPTIEQNTALFYLALNLGGFVTSGMDSALSDFQTNLRGILQQLQESCPTAQIILTNQYNPYGILKSNESYGALAEQFDAGVGKLNTAIDEVCQDFDVTVVDVHTPFAEELAAGGNPCNAGIDGEGKINPDFHPNQVGHSLIADAITAELADAPEPGDEPNLYVGGVGLYGDETTVAYAKTDGTTGKVTTTGASADDYNIKWDGATLTLNNANIKGEYLFNDKIGQAAIYSDGDIKIELAEGSTNQVEAAAGDSPACGIYSRNGSITISGNGALTVTANGQYSYGIGTEWYGNITINSDTLNVAVDGDYSYGIQCGMGIITISGGTVNVTAAGQGSCGIYNMGSDLVISGGTIDVIATGENSLGIGVSGLSKAIISGGTITAVGEADGFFGSIVIAPPDGDAIRVKVGADEDSAREVPGSPFDGEQDIRGYGMKYFYSQVVAPVENHANLYIGGVGLYGDKASQTTAYAKTVNGTVTTTGATAEDYNIKWDGETLTLEDVNIQNGYIFTADGDHAAIYSEKTFKIELLGTNTVTLGLEDGDVFGIQGEEDIAISGSGTLTVTASGSITSCGILAKGNAAISGGTVTAYGDTAGIFVLKDFTVSGGSTVVGNANDDGSGGIQVVGSFTISDGSKVSADAVGEGAEGIAVSDSMIVNNSEVIAKGESRGLLVLGLLTVNGKEQAVQSNDEVHICADGTVIWSGNYPLWVGSTQVSSENAGDVLGDGTVSYDPDTATLTLRNANITQAAQEKGAIYSYDDVNVVLEGENTVAAGGENGIYVYDDLTISGSGSLVVEGSSAGISVDRGVLTVSGGEVMAKGGDTGIESFHTITVSGGTILATGDDAGIITYLDVIISGGTVTATGGRAGIDTIGAVTISGGTVTATGSDMGIFAGDSVVISPQSGWQIAVTAGADQDGATAIDGSPFRGKTDIIDLVYGKSYFNSQTAVRPSSGGGSSSTTTETTTNPDGSTTTTVTDKGTGTVTETTKWPDGSKEVVETKKDGTVTTTTTGKDGSSSVATVDEHGRMEAEVQLPADLVEAAQEKGETVFLPMPEAPVTAERDEAPTVTVDLPSGTSVQVEIPVKGVTAGTVAVLVKDDGTEEVIKTSFTTENGVAVTLNDGDTVKIVDNSKTFTDIPASHWSAEAVGFTASRELFAGTSATTFSPDAAMSRAMIVTVLARFEGVDTTTGDTWYEAGRQWAMTNGISDGANMDQALTREQLATMLWRYAGSPSATADLSKYTDAASISDWAVQAMSWAVEQGIIGGTTSTTLSPQGQATRAQAAVMLMRFCELDK